MKFYSLREVCSTHKLNKIYEKRAFGFASYEVPAAALCGFVYSPSVRTVSDLHNVRKMNTRST